jgi:hypothetical protein
MFINVNTIHIYTYIYLILKESQLFYLDRQTDKKFVKMTLRDSSSLNLAQNATHTLFNTEKTNMMTKLA